MRIVNLISSGLADYRDVDALQRKLHHEVCEGAEDALIFVEFTPTYTAGRHTKDHHIPDSSLPIISTDRAGSVTWHGPGQLVCYPIVQLAGTPVDTYAWIRAVENGVLAMLQKEWDLDVCRIKGRAGVWLPAPDRKICAIGLKVAKNGTLHGLALNVDVDFTQAFTGIIPCGLNDAGVTSLCLENVVTTVEAASTLLIPHLLDSIAPRLARPLGQIRTISDLATIFERAK